VCHTANALFWSDQQFVDGYEARGGDFEWLRDRGGILHGSSSSRGRAGGEHGAKTTGRDEQRQQGRLEVDWERREMKKTEKEAK
jgi:hypothetical protein